RGCRRPRRHRSRGGTEPGRLPDGAVPGGPGGRSDSGGSAARRPVAAGTPRQRHGPGLHAVLPVRTAAAPTALKEVSMSHGTSALGQVGAACFGIAVGYITYRTLVRTTEKAAISDLGAVVSAIGGAAVTGLFAPRGILFAWYSIGLLAGMALFFV